MPQPRDYFFPSMLVALLALQPLACSSETSGGTNDPNPNPQVPGSFESDDPRSSEPGRDGDGASSGTGGTSATGGTGNSPQAPGEDGGAEDPSRDIEEADIIKVQGDRLYALSQYGGLSVIDVSNPDDLKLLGRHKAQAIPFEMYVRDNIAFVLYDGYGEYEEQEDGSYIWAQSGYVIALDTTDPKHITRIGKFPVRGQLSDSRIVGDVLYVVGYENGYCWGCEENAPKTTVISLDVSAPADIHQVDELDFPEQEDQYGWWRRSVTATNERLYIAGPTWGNAGPQGSTIQVVDISDAEGDLELGAAVEAAGKIDSRWQMDEADGVLRVISQTGEWRPTDPPSIQTFAVESSTSITPLASVPMTIPAGEDLRSVRFDGPRGYAITALQTDPLFTIDLSDPAAPKQVGELEMPGWIYHMEPRGDRVLALGFDNANTEGSLNVSLFDVSDLANPAMLKRVNFGGDWGSFAEDQDRIHKAFNILGDAGLILLPFSGYDYDEQSPYYCGQYTSGIQLIDWADDSLELRGVASAVGQARRGFLIGDRLFSVSDERVETFDIADRSHPEKKSALPLAHYVTRTLTSGDHVVRIGQNWWTNTTQVDVARASAVTSPVSLGSIDVPGLENASSCSSYSYLSDSLIEGDRVYLVYDTYNYESVEKAQTTRLLTVSIEDPAHPAVLGDVELPFGRDWSYGYIYGVPDTGKSLLLVNGALVMVKQAVNYDENYNYIASDVGLRIVDLADPSAPKTKEVTLGLSLGTTGLVASGNTVAISRYLRSDSNSDRVRFFVDRVDVSKPSAPRVLPAANVPGSLLAYDDATERSWNVDYRWLTEQTTRDDCYSALGSYQFTIQPGHESDQNPPGSCTFLQQTLRLVQLGEAGAALLDSHELEQGFRVGNVGLGDDRLFVTRGYDYYWGVGDCFDCGYYGYYYSSLNAPATDLWTFSGFDSGEINAGHVELAGGGWGYGGSVLGVSGKRALVLNGWYGKLSVVQANDASDPELVREEPYVGSLYSVEVDGDRAILSLGYDGVQTISLED